MPDYDLERVRVLIVEDNPHMRRLVRTILTSLGIREVAVAEDGTAAIEALRRFDADIVVCDWEMQPMDGIALAREIRLGDDSPNPYVPIIMLTGHTAVQRVMTARDAGVNEFLAKPVSAAGLYNRIKAIVEQPRQFVRTPDYFGPDRRRRQDPDYDGEERRKPRDDGDRRPLADEATPPAED